MEMVIDKELLEMKQAAIEYIESCNPLEMYWDYRDEFSKENVSKILAGKLDEVIDELWEWNVDYVSEMEWSAAEEALKIAGIYKDETDEAVWDELVCDVRDHITIDMNLWRLFANTSAYVGIELDADIIVDSYSYHLEYDDYRNALGLLYINPRKFSDAFDITPKFPNYPWRDGKEKCKPDDFIESICNTFYSGRLVIMMGYQLDLENFSKNMTKIKEEGFTLKVGARVVPHDFINGASGVEFFTTGDIKIKPEMIYDIYNDGKCRYGIQACCGYIDSAWESVIELSDGTQL